MRALGVLGAALALAGCDKEYATARNLVQANIGKSAALEFHGLRHHSKWSDVVCGEVSVDDGGWRPFVSYNEQKQAVVGPVGGFDPAAEMGDPLLSGSAAGFNHTCD